MKINNNNGHNDCVTCVIVDDICVYVILIFLGAPSVQMHSVPPDWVINNQTSPEVIIIMMDDDDKYDDEYYDEDDKYNMLR
jgi:hypothetical protein